MAPYTVEEATRREDLDSIVDVIWAAMDGFDPSHQIFFPVLGDGKAAREAAIQSSKDRTWEDHKSDPSSHWMFVRDKASGHILGGCQWRTYTENPFPNGTPHIEAIWWPEGEGRCFASEVVRQCYAPRTKWMAYPHVGKLHQILQDGGRGINGGVLGLSLLCVRPRYQRCGVGRLLMEWGLAKMDVLGLESFLEATDSGKGLYAKCGYRPVKEVTVNVDRADPSAEWRELTKQLMPIGYTAMWRPKGGIWRTESHKILGTGG